jgi:hypothetical protein
MPLAVLSPSPDRVAQSLGLGASELGNGARFVLGALLYGRAAAAVTLRESPGSRHVVTSAASDGDVTAHVTYLYYCALPFADRFLCDSPGDLTGLLATGAVARELAARRGSGDYGAASGATPDIRAVSGSGELTSLSEELRWAENPELLIPLLLGGARFRVISAEATLPNQGACYYPGSSCFKGDRREPRR